MKSRLRIRRTRMVIERREVRIVSIGQPVARGRCERCDAVVTFVSLDAAARVADEPVRAVFERAMAGEIHVSDSVVQGQTLVCLASLLESQ